MKSLGKCVVILIGKSHPKGNAHGLLYVMVLYRFNHKDYKGLEGAACDKSVKPEGQIEACYRGPNLTPGCKVVHLLADDRLFSTRGRESSRKIFSRFFCTQSFFLCKKRRRRC